MQRQRSDSWCDGNMNAYPRPQLPGPVPSASRCAFWASSLARPDFFLRFLAGGSWPPLGGIVIGGDVPAGAGGGTTGGRGYVGRSPGDVEMR